MSKSNKPSKPAKSDKATTAKIELLEEYVEEFDWSGFDHQSGRASQ